MPNTPQPVQLPPPPHPFYLILSVSDRCQVETEPAPAQQRGVGEAGGGEKVEWQIVVKDADRGLNRTLPAREISDILLDWRWRGGSAFLSALPFISLFFFHASLLHLRRINSHVVECSWLKVQMKYLQEHNPGQKKKKASVFWLKRKKKRCLYFCTMTALWPSFIRAAECTNLLLCLD